jgi:2-polyprenyl-3-methyl-5-hydroxy-6-metoxy-1,4-benzoquinol methylase
MITKIKLDLFNLKPKEDLSGVYQFFKKQSEKWFNSALEPKEIYFSPTKCPLCFGADGNEVYKIDGFSYHECQSCKSLYTNPHLNADVLETLYSDGAYQVYHDSLVKKGLGLRKGVLEERKFSQIQSLLKGKGATLLDVGCGGASFLDVCKRKGWKVEGVDPSSSSSKVASESYDITVHHGEFQDINFDKTFDVITLWGVLEHMSDPISALRKVESLLNVGGVLAFEVPSADCFLSEYLRKYEFSPTRYIESGRHNIFFSREFISSLTKSFPFQLELIESNGLDIQTIFMTEFEANVTDQILNIQDVLNDLLLGDHYRVFFRKIDK